MLTSLPPGMVESFGNSFAKGIKSLFPQQDKQLAGRKELSPTLPAPPLTMRMMQGLATGLAAKLSLLRCHPVMRATASLADLAASGVQPELLSHSCRRLKTISHLLPVPWSKSEL
jgi:hypothetical protein